jgi:serine/threonine protein kinase
MKGSGTSCNVYRGYFNKKEIAIKCTKTNLYKDQFLKELVILQDLYDPNIINCYGYSVNIDDEIFILMEYAENGTLSKKIQEKKLTMEQKLIIMNNIIEGMIYLHSRRPPLIHRFVKN